MKRRLLTRGPGNDPLWVRRSVQPYADHWAAMLVGDEVAPPEPDKVTGLTFLGATPDEAERAAKVYLGLAEPGN